MLGFPDRALQRANEAIDLANRINHPFSLTYALFHSGLLHLWRREVETVLERAQAVLEIAAKYEFKIWQAVSTCLYGAALAGLNRVEEGCIRIKEGMDLYEELKTPPVFWPLLLILRAGASGQAGKTGEGLRLSDQALEIIGRDSGNPVSSEIFRLKGDLLLMHDPRNPAEAEKCFRQALEVGRERQAGMLILRASISLSRLWQTQNKGEQGRQLLREAYDTFSEGFSTADLTEAKTLLEEPS
jgi:predicted ATPase